VTSPVISHVRENDAILHGKTPHEMAMWIKQLAREYGARGLKYKHRCSVARELAADRSIETVYPQLKALLTDSNPTPEQERTKSEPTQPESTGPESSVIGPIGDTDEND